MNSGIQKACWVLSDRLEDISFRLSEVTVAELQVLIDELQGMQKWAEKVILSITESNEWNKP